MRCSLLPAELLPAQRRRAPAVCTTHQGRVSRAPLMSAPTVEPGHHACGQAPDVSLGDRARARGKHVYCGEAAPSWPRDIAAAGRQMRARQRHGRRA